MKQLKQRLAAFLTAAVLLAGCSSEDSSSDKTSQTESTTPSVTTTTAAQVTTTTASSAATTAKSTYPLPIIGEKMKDYDGLELNGTACKICDIDGSSAAIMCLTDDKQTCYVFDAVNGKVTRSFTTVTYADELLGVLSDGTLVFLNNSTNRIYTVAPGSDAPKELDIDNGSASWILVDRKKDDIYWTDSDNRVIMKTDLSGKGSPLFEGDAIFAVNSLSTEDMIFQAVGYADDEFTTIANGIYSLETGKNLAFFKQQGQFSFMTAEGYVNICVADALDAFTPVYFDIYDPEDGKYTGTYSYGHDNNNFLVCAGHHSGGTILINVYETYGQGALKKLLVFDVRTGRIADTGLVGKEEIMQSQLCRLENTGCWLTTLTVGMGANARTKVVLLNTEELTYDEKLDKITREDAVVQKYECGERFRPVRDKADEIEKKYGVKMYVGDEVMALSDVGGRNALNSAETSVNPEIVQEELSNLEKLDQVMSAFPKGFFDHFKNKNGKGGLGIAMVLNHMTAPGSSFLPAGMTSKDGVWYNISMDGYMIFDNEIFYHELWHAVELMVKEKYPFDEEKWNALNPSGFSYLNNFETYATSTETDQDTLNIVAIETPIRYEAPYFVRDYSKVNGMEDRATILESVFQWAYARFEKTSDACAELSKYPHIKAKIDFLGEWSKQEFGYIYWEKMLK